MKKLVDKLSKDPAENSNQKKYEAILKRKCYENDCFLQCVLLRLETHRGGSTVESVQNSWGGTSQGAEPHRGASR